MALNRNHTVIGLSAIAQNPDAAVWRRLLPLIDVLKVGGEDGMLVLGPCELKHHHRLKRPECEQFLLSLGKLARQTPNHRAENRTRPRLQIAHPAPVAPRADNFHLPLEGPEANNVIGAVRVFRDRRLLSRREALMRLVLSDPGRPHMLRGTERNITPTEHARHSLTTP